MTNMIRRMIEIDAEKCNGCGACAQACHEGAIGMVNGKAVLLRDDYCDGLGDCLPTCPTGAITFVEREAAAYDPEAVKRHQQGRGCPGSQPRSFSQSSKYGGAASVPSQLSQWPVQIKLVPLQAPYFTDADLLIAADCTAFAYGNFHSEFLRGRIALIGCPKLDSVDYTEKLTQILRQNSIRSITVVRMEVPCCGGIEHAARQAAQQCGKQIPLEIVTLSINGQKLG